MTLGIPVSCVGVMALPLARLLCVTGWSVTTFRLVRTTISSLLTFNCRSFCLAVNPIPFMTVCIMPWSALQPITTNLSLSARRLCAMCRLSLSLLLTLSSACTTSPPLCCGIAVLATCSMVVWPRHLPVSLASVALRPASVIPPFAVAAPW